MSGLPPRRSTVNNSRKPSSPPACSSRRVPVACSSWHAGNCRPIQKRVAEVAGVSASVKLEKTFDGGKYGFSIQYPNGWTFRDKTAAMKPASPGGCWIVFGRAPIETSSVEVNVRRVRLEPGTDADAFAKQNPYVSSWEQKNRMDSPAFSTTSTTPGSKKVIHRMIIIKGAMAWMLNCIDTTGKSTSNSGDIFESMVSTLK